MLASLHPVKTQPYYSVPGTTLSVALNVGDARLRPKAFHCLVIANIETLPRRDVVNPAPGAMPSANHGSTK